MFLVLPSTGASKEREKELLGLERNGRGLKWGWVEELCSGFPWRAFVSPRVGSYPNRWHTGNGRCGHIPYGSTQWWPRLLGSWNKSGKERGKTGETASEGPGRWLYR